ncbi:hypothetical protein NQ315_013064 [Exocentrus adspersus]|uniref:Uncharacterized protein n=1 Tax=Exocentrus adspersus TaxID=1586481 RepID=A0AAV8VWI1_9CUCU|nr:hypothetical protein NQ315_013064 [Exocentrus adspersus]
MVTKYSLSSSAIRTQQRVLKNKKDGDDQLQVVDSNDQVSEEVVRNDQRGDLQRKEIASESEDASFFLYNNNRQGPSFNAETSSMRRRLFAGMKSLTGFGSRSRHGSPGHRSISLPESTTINSIIIKAVCLCVRVFSSISSHMCL